MQLGNGAMWLGDCLDMMRHIPDGSVDMVLCDLPYGTTACSWDVVIPFEPLWHEYWRVCKGAVVLTAGQPFTSALIMSQPKAFKYCWVWDKVIPRGHLVAKKRPMAQHEDVCVFGKGSLPYYPIKTLRDKPIVGKEGKRTTIMGGETTGFTATYTHKYPTTIQTFKPDKDRTHPTQKPVALFDYLIRTYTNPGNLVLDNCSGSGTTAIAAQASGRRFICIERDEKYYHASCLRLAFELQKGFTA